MGAKHRERIENRTTFSLEEKQLMLNKSRSKCAMCGKPLTVYTMTAEHAIPLSKGGTNDLSNLIALCQTCNGEKDNFILSPQYCYKHINKSVMKELIKLFDAYVKNTNWLSFTNMLPADIGYISTPRIVVNKSAVSMYLYDVKVSRIDMRTRSDAVDVVKARVAEWNSKYMKDPKPIDDFIDYISNKCAFYLIGNSLESGVILPISIDLSNFEDNSFESSKMSDYAVSKEHYVLKFWNPIMDVTNIHTCIAVDAVVSNIIEIISDKAAENNIGIIPVVKEFSTANQLYYNVLISKTTDDLYDVWKRRAEIIKDIPTDSDEFKTYFYFKYSSRFKESIQNSDEDTRWILSGQELTKFDRFIQKYCTKNEDYYE